MNDSILFAPEAPADTGDTGLTGLTGPALADGGRLSQERLVELIARTWLEPALADRYRADARSVLDEFGVTLAVGEQAPALPELPVCELSIEELTRPTTAHAPTCVCWVTDAWETAPRTPSAETRTILR
ncbi:TIGR04351 family putative TOMM peptide [Streptomyces jumonjinensis]|uniref:Putative TOMM peptide n=1 Tax=Streptomyces jumonjinensis TaxID=1945 RepID=A0A646KMY1_STRJU|nr:TIGR04351 family putative TOMM peptide [Streptomyces jumonjinensis]MQT03593.1 putative TOMM peptide [Streptomyces jumonjinensis]